MRNGLQQPKWLPTLLSGLLILQSSALANAHIVTTLNESCLAVVKDIFSEDKKQLLCQTPSGMLYAVPFVDDQWIDEKMISGELYSGETWLDLPMNTTVNREDQTLNLNDIPTLVTGTKSSERRLRQLARTTGDKSVLAVRIIAENSQFSKNEEELAASVFGGPNDFINLKSQYSACSHGKLNMVKRPDLDGLTTNVRNGVVTIRVSLPIEVGHSTMVNAVSQELSREFGLTMDGIADHVMYCLPKDTYNGVGYAVMNRGLSVYNDKLCTSVSTQMHEIGHNLNLGHSAMGSDRYGDQSGMMGYSYRSSETPQMCFNAAKSFQLGWYDNKSTSYAPGTKPWGDDHTFTVSNIVDYATTIDDVLLEIVQPTRQLNYYITFNAVKGFMSGVRAAKNQVVVYEKPSVDGNDSWRVADLSSGESFSISDFNGVTGDTLTITAVSINLGTSEAVVRVKLNRAKPLPTDAPTSRPTPAPTIAPTRIPTPTPTKAPTRRPIPSPTVRPTPNPTRPIGGRNPTIDVVAQEVSCSVAYSTCETSADCCAGFSCRRVSGDSGFSNVCRAIAKNSKDKLQRADLAWWKRRLRGDAGISMPLEPRDELLEEESV